MSPTHAHEQDFAALIAIDWADKKHDLVVLDVATGKTEHRQIEHTPEAIEEWCNTIRTQFRDRPVAVCLEQSRGALIHCLMHHGFLTLYPINPKQLKKFRDALCPSGAKDDPTDAALLLEILQKHRDRLKAWKPDDEKTRLLGFLVEHRRQAVSDRTRLSNRLTSTLKGYFPQAVSWVGETVFSLQACNFLQKWSTLAQVKRAKPETIRSFYYAQGSRRGDLIEKRIEEIREAMPLTTDVAIVEASVMRVQSIVLRLIALHESINKYDRRIEKLFQTHEDAALFKDLPGAGAQMAPRLLVAFGTQRDRFDSALELQTYAGIAPVTVRSGNSLQVHWRMACPKFLRQSFHEWAALSVRKSIWARLYYDQQRQAGKRHHAAVRALAYKWIRILYRCWQDRVPYDEQRYLQALQKRQSPLAQLLDEAA